MMDGVELKADLDLKLPSPELTDENAPYTSWQVMGNWLKELTDYKNYLDGGAYLGAEVARYKQAYDEGKIDDFAGGKFAKETFKSGVRTLGGNSLHTLGTLTKMVGENIKQHPYAAAALSGGLSVVMPKVGEDLVHVGDVFTRASDKVYGWTALAPDEEIYQDNPSWTGLANILGSASAHLLTMGMMSKYIGAKPTYGLFALGGSSEMYEAARADNQEVDTANTAALINGSVSYALDRIFSPLPKQLEKRAQMTAHEIAKEAVGASFRESATEVLQQIGAENMVRKAGIDETQNLFEGVIESALGGMLGSTVLSAADGSFYAVNKRLQQAKQNMLLRGISAEELQLAENNMTEFLKTKPEAFEKVLRWGLQENLQALENSAADTKDFRSLYQMMYDKTYDSLHDKKTASLAAGLLQANALILHEADPHLATETLAQMQLPKVVRTDSDSFLKNMSKPDNIRYQFGGVNAKFADRDKLARALDMAERNISPERIWAATGWHRGGDGLYRFEISDENAKFKLWDLPVIHKNALEYYQQDVQRLTEMIDDNTTVLKQMPHALQPYLAEFETYLKNRFGETPIDEKTFRENYVAALHFDESIKRDIVNHKLSRQRAQLKRGDFQFSEEDWKMLKALEEQGDIFRFKQKYRYPAANFERVIGKIFNHKLKEYTHDPDKLKQLFEFMNAYKEEKTKFEEMLHDKGLQNNREFFNEFYAEKAYLLDKIFQTKNDAHFQSREYKEAYAQKTVSEAFLTQPTMPKFERIELDTIASFLDVEEQVFWINRYLHTLKDNVNLYDKFNYQNNLSYFALEKANQYQADLMLAHKRIYKLGEVLEHEELYRHYPELKNVDVQFVRLKDNQAYHFYTNHTGQFVLEINPDMLAYSDITDTLLKGAQYAVQNIEDFEITLTDKQKKTFMNRELYLAKTVFSDSVKEYIGNYTAKFLDGAKAEDYYTDEKMPISLLSLAESEGTALPDKNTVLTFTEPDFAKLTADTIKKYGNYKTPEEEKVYLGALNKVQRMKMSYATMLTDEMRAQTGVSLPNLDWAWESVTGQFDNNAMINRRFLTAEERLQKPYWKSGSDNSATELTNLIGENNSQQPIFERDILHRLPDDEIKFAKQLPKLKETIADLAQGAYDRATKTISLFKSESAETIVHEMFHYFNQVLESREVRQNKVLNDIYRYSRDKLQEDFVRQCRIKEVNGKYYVTEAAYGTVEPHVLQAFDNPLEAFNAGVEELFVTTFMDHLNSKTELKRFESVEGLEKLYAHWLKRVVYNLKIKKEESSESAGKLLQYLRTKLK